MPYTPGFHRHYGKIAPTFSAWFFFTRLYQKDSLYYLYSRLLSSAVEQKTLNLLVLGSNPRGGIFFIDRDRDRNRNRDRNHNLTLIRS